MEKMKEPRLINRSVLIRTLFVFTVILLSFLSLSTIAQSTTANQNIDFLQVAADEDLQTIINNARAHQTLQLLPGIYTQQLRITKPLTITSSNPETTIISATTLPNQPAISITADDVTLKNLTIQNNADGIYTTAIRITAENTMITNCIIHHTPVGIAIWTSNNTITQSRFHHCADEGIVLLTTSYSPCRNNIISHCTFTHNCDAIELQQSTHNQIINCTMTHNTHSGIDAIIKNNDHNIISSCTITDNQVHGIYLSSSSNNLISSCHITNNTDGNIIQPNSFHNTILNQSHLTQQKNLLLEQNSIERQTPSSVLSLIKQKITSIQLQIINMLQTFLSFHSPA
ncbi:MAG: right-handed parallel beta-helix repeat-containing protein [Thermoplasmatota archaeon]